MRKQLSHALVRWSALIGLLAASGLLAQLSVRPEDPSGFSLREPRVQVIHSDRPDVPGTSMHLQQTDPWLTYAIGHEYFEHEWTRREGVFKSLTQRGAAGTVNSCAMCHNAPFRSAGFGGTVFDPPGPGRRVPHLFGIGLVEMIGFQIRERILAQYDTNHNGYLDVPSETAGRRARVVASPGVWVDFGSLDDLDGDGMPDLNELIKVIMVDRQGRPVPPRPDGAPPRLGDPAVAGFDIDVAVLSTAIGDHQFSSLRTFLEGVMNTVFGLRVIDPTAASGEAGGWARASNAGAPQRHFPLPAGSDICPRLDRVSAGEVDLLEWYLLNHPPPGLARQDSSSIHGRRLLAQYGCTTCHIADWTLEPESEDGAGDRRFFDLEVSYSRDDDRLEGRVHDLTKTVGNGPAAARLPRRLGYTVRGVFSDFQHHDIGPRFYDYSNDRGKLYVTKRFRTAPLWGVGSLPHYGHDGRSPLASTR